MNRPKSTTRKSSTPIATSKNKKQLSDTVYLMQNENQILKLKNQQLSYKLDSLNTELKQRSQRVTDAQRECQKLRQVINGSIYVNDIELQNQKKILLDKIVLGTESVQIYKEKIADARKQVVLEEERIPFLIVDRRRFQQQLRIVKMENQGSKKVLINIETQNEQLRQRNNSLSLKKYSKQPEQRAISDQIEQRIRLIKNTNSTQKQFKKQKIPKLILQILQNLSFQRKKISFLTLQRYGLKKAILKKKFFLLAHIRKNYLNSVKARIMSVFREPLKPLAEEEKCVRILKEIRSRRQKAKIWRIWRNETAKNEYSLIRKYESQNTIQKICQILAKSTLISTFHMLKNFNNYHRPQIAVSKIYSTLSKALSKQCQSFIGLLKKDKNKYQIEQEIQNSAQQQSKMLGLSKIFFGWVALMKEKRKQSLSLKFKYFKRLKKIFVVRKRNVLSEMLAETKIKISSINILSICFAALKKQLYQNKEQRAIEENDRVNRNLKNLKEDTENRQKFDVQLDREIALMKISKYLQKEVKEALTIWRRQNQRIHSVEKINSILSFNLKKIVNYAFSRIQIRRFQNLKVSIREKIKSCDYSYNYLVEENTHIKEVLDKKSHQLQKTKFVTIIQKLIRKQKEIKHKYFYRFLRSGYKFWKIKKSLEKIDAIMSKRISILFLFLLKFNKRQKVQQQKIQNWIHRKEHDQTQLLLRTSIKGFKLFRQRNRTMRTILSGIFDRNLELNQYQAFGKLRKQHYDFEIHEMTSAQNQIISSINETSSNIQNTEQIIQILNQRLRNKEETLRERKTMTIYKFFLKNIREKVGSFLWKWKNKVDNEKKIIQFVDILDRKTQSMVKMKFLIALQKSKEEFQKKQLENRLEKYKSQYENSNVNFEKFLATSEEKIVNMKSQNEQNDRIAKENEIKYDHMNEVIVESFLKHWGKNMCKFVFREWKIQKNDFLKKWNRVFDLLKNRYLQDGFQKLSIEIKSQMIRDRVRNTILKAYNKNFKSNAGLGFRIWRNLNVLKKIKHSEASLKQAMKGMEHMGEHYEYVKEKYNAEVDTRISMWRMRRLTSAWRIYTQKKINNNIKKRNLINWLSTGYSTEIIRILSRHRSKLLSDQRKIISFQTKFNNRKAKAFLDYLYMVRARKHSIQRLFMGKFCYYQLYKLKEEFFTRVKNFQRQKQINQRDRRTFSIQKVINCFQKKRKDILCQNMRIWKRNMYKIQIEKNLFKRVVRKAMNNRVKDLFYAWKVETEARSMVREHTEQGQIKRRKVQIKRIKKFLDDYKKEKGLLLENQEGNYVVSPKFQENKEKQLKRQNLLKYKFVSRLILSMNGYQSPVKSWTNLQLFTKMRIKCQRLALVVKNRMQKADLYTSFKIWHNEVKETRKMFEEMERKDLIRLLNRQKDKMEMEYSKKVDVQQNVERQLRRYKLFSYQDKRKQRICAQILFREARKVKSFAFQTWRKRVEEMKDNQIYDLEDRGNNKLLYMEEEVQDLQQKQRDLQEHNRMLRQAVQEALELADIIKRISDERDELRRELSERDISCQNLQEENQELNNKLVLAQKQAMNLLTLSNKGI